MTCSEYLSISPGLSKRLYDRYHLNMLVEAGYMTGKIAMNAPVISKLTWQGHELLDDIRAPDIWAKTKEKPKWFPDLVLRLCGNSPKVRLRKS